MKKLTRFWIKFSKVSMGSMVKSGCGVTAYDYDDAIEIISHKLFKGEKVPLIESFIKDVDIQDLDKYHVLPNIGISSNRGVWFPNLNGSDLLD